MTELSAVKPVMVFSGRVREISCSIVSQGLEFINFLWYAEYPEYFVMPLSTEKEFHSNNKNIREKN
jgi:hypothetical protein